MFWTCYGLVSDTMLGSRPLVTDLLRGTWCEGFWPLSSVICTCLLLSVIIKTEERWSKIRPLVDTVHYKSFIYLRMNSCPMLDDAWKEVRELVVTAYHQAFLDVCIYSKTKFHPDLIWNDGALGFYWRGRPTWTITMHLFNYCDTKHWCGPNVIFTVNSFCGQNFAYWPFNRFR